MSRNRSSPRPARGRSAGSCSAWRSDRKEFIRAVRVDARVPDTKITDREVDELFKCVDTGDGLISGEEFRLFLAAKKDMKKKAMSGALGRKKGDSVEGDGATSPRQRLAAPARRTRR